MLRYVLLSAVVLFFFSAASAQEKVTLSGYVKDADNGEELLGVTIYIPSLKAGTITNDYGVRLSIFQNIGHGDVYHYEDPKDNIDIIRTDTISYGKWESIKTYINDGGGMFGSIPTAPRTNLSNDALGFFQVSAVAEKETQIE